MRLAFFLVVAACFGACGRFVAVTHDKHRESGSGKKAEDILRQLGQIAPFLRGTTVVSRQEVRIDLVRNLNALMIEPAGYVLDRNAFLQK